MAVRFRLVLILAVLVPVRFATKLYEGAGAAWMHAHAGGFFYVIFWCLLALVIWPRLSPSVVGVTVFLITSILEFLQLWHPPPLQIIRSTFLGQALREATSHGPTFRTMRLGPLSPWALFNSW